MRKLINYINKRVLGDGLRLHSATVLTKILSGFLTTKFIAIYIGAEGMALIGNMRSFLSAIQASTTLGMYNGVVKYVGKFKDDINNLSKIISTAYYLGFGACILLGLLCYYNAQSINDLVFTGDYNFSYIIKIMALALPFYALNLFSFAIMNGFSKLKNLMVFNIIGQIMGLCVTLVLIWQDNIDGALIAVVISPSLIFLITMVGILNRRSLIGLIKVSSIDFEMLKKISPYAVMAIISGIIMPLVMIGIRNYIIAEEGMKDAGLWEAMNRISVYYMMFVNSIMTLYFLPRFSEIDNINDFRNEVFDFYKTVVPVFGLGLFAVFLLKPFIVALFLTDEFVNVEALFGWQLLGDFAKILSIVIAYHFLAKKMFLHFIITEVFLVVMLYISSVYLIDLYGVKGANIGHFVSYLLYFIIVLLIFGGSIFGVFPDEDQKELFN